VVHLGSLGYKVALAPGWIVAANVVWVPNSVTGYKVTHFGLAVDQLDMMLGVSKPYYL
jgi:hypothetical protein